MSTVAFSSQGSKLKVKISGAYTDIPSCVGIPVPPTDPAYDDITNLDSPSGYPERLPIGKNFVDVAHELIWDPSNAVHNFLETASFNQTQCDFETVASNAGGATYQYSGFVKWEPKLDARKAGRISLTINVTGAVVRTV